MALAVVLALPLEGQIAPDRRWRSVETEHFTTTFPAELEAIGVRTAALAERALAELEPIFGAWDDGRIRLLLTDDTDASNGFARVAPYPQVVVYARPPIDGFALSHVDDWLDLVVTHELVHVLHLDRTGLPGHLLRGVFGRVPAGWPLFPGFGVPGWVIEGLATRFETRLTGTGRVAGTDFDMLLRTAALEGELETIDAASGDSPVWPAGERRYVYGALFLEHLAQLYGEAALVAFVDEVANAWIPLRIDAAAERAFGVSFSEAWRDWVAEREARAARIAAELGAPPAPVETVRGETRWAVNAAAREGRLVWTELETGGDWSLRVREPDGEIWGHRVHGRVHADLLPDGRVLVAQPEFLDPYRTPTDLWILTRDAGLTRLTRGARLDHPSVGPDGRWAVAVRYLPGTTELVRVDLVTGEVRTLVPARPEHRVGLPALSPDGTRVAFSEWRPGGTDLVLADARDGRRLATLVADGARNLAPAWDGPDRLVWGTDASGISQLVAASLGPDHRLAGPPVALTRVGTGARFPAVDDAGNLFFSLHHLRGWALARTASSPLDPPVVLAADPVATLPVRLALDPPPDTATTPYRVFDTFRPWYWEPVFIESTRTGEVDVVPRAFGARTGLEDLVGRHALDLQIAVATDGSASGGAEYRWRGLGNPELGIRVEQEWDGQGPFPVVRADSTTDRLIVRERERRAVGFVTFRRVRWWSRTSLRLEAGAIDESRSLRGVDGTSEQEFVLRRPEARLFEFGATLSGSTARAAPLSISLEEGVNGWLTLRRRLETALPDSLAGVRGRDRTRTEAIGQLRGYHSFGGPGFADHVIAVRGVGGWTGGSGSDDFDWELGGISGAAEPLTGFGLFGGESAFFGVRGIERGRATGYGIWASALEYRFPLALVNRGLGLIPVHLDRVHGALFWDAGGTWRRDTGYAGTLHALGAELRSEWLLAFDIPLTVRTGLSVPTDGTPAGVWIRFGANF